MNRNPRLRGDLQHSGRLDTSRTFSRWNPHLLTSERRRLGSIQLADDFIVFICCQRVGGRERLTGFRHRAVPVIDCYRPKKPSPGCQEEDAACRTCRHRGLLCGLTSADGSLARGNYVIGGRNQVYVLTTGIMLTGRRWALRIRGIAWK